LAKMISATPKISFVIIPKTFLFVKHILRIFPENFDNTISGRR